MKTMLKSLLGSLTIIGLAGCGEKTTEGAGADVPRGSTVESIKEEIQSEMEIFARTIRSAKDKESAEKAAAEIEKVAERLQKWTSRLAKMNLPPEATRKRLGKELSEYEQSLDDKLGDLEETMEELDPETRKAVSKILGEFGQKMQGVTVVLDKYFLKPEIE